MPSSIVRKVDRCLEAPFDELVARGVLPSSETVAAVLPQLTARTRAQAIADPALRRVFEATYLAFRRHPPLSSRDVDSHVQQVRHVRQVQFGELPWIDALTPWAGSDEATRESAREILRQVSSTVLAEFPHTTLPNKLLKELRAIAASAGMKLPLVDELAADHFTGSFAENYLRAAQDAARTLHGTLYERYYDIPYASLLELNDPAPPSSGTPVSPGFAALCQKRAAEQAPKASATALHGAILEQAQVLTTHNLATLCHHLDLAAELPLSEMARAAFERLCRRQQQPQKDWRSQLHVLKNTAHAFRQLVFYLALSPRSEQTAFVAFCRERLARQRPEFRERFGPAIAGLEAIIAGDSFDRAGVHEVSGGRRLLAWTAGTHWLLRRRTIPRRSQHP